MINSMTFEFGTQPGQYPITGFITDSIFRVAEVSGIGYGTQFFTHIFSQGVGYVNYSNAFTPTAGDKIEVFFRNPVNMSVCTN